VQRLGRALLAAGADLVFGHSAHHIQVSAATVPHVHSMCVCLVLTRLAGVVSSAHHIQVTAMHLLLTHVLEASSCY
jgi:hypothetical protein